MLETFQIWCYIAAVLVVTAFLPQPGIANPSLFENNCTPRLSPQAPAKPLDDYLSQPERSPPQLLAAGRGRRSRASWPSSRHVGSSSKGGSLASRAPL